MLNVNKIFRNFDQYDHGEFMAIMEIIEYDFHGKSLTDLIKFLDEDINYDGALDTRVDDRIEYRNYDLRLWMVDNYEYVNEAIEEFGTTGDIHKDIQAGQYIYYSELFQGVIARMIDYINENYNV